MTHVPQSVSTATDSPATSTDDETLTTTVSRPSLDLTTPQDRSSRTSPITSTDDETLTTTVSISSSDLNSSRAPQDMRLTTSTRQDQNNQGTFFRRSRLVVPMASSIGSVILITLILVMIVVASIIVVKSRQQRKLLNIKVRKNGHHHIGLGKLLTCIIYIWMLKMLLFMKITL